jgi:hypothetical protein
VTSVDRVGRVRFAWQEIEAAREKERIHLQEEIGIRRYLNEGRLRTRPTSGRAGSTIR